MLKINTEKVAKTLQIIFNKYLAQCKHPSVWKIARSIDPSVPTIEEVSGFKNKIKKITRNEISIPKYYYYGPRKPNILLTQFRCSAIFLN